MENLTKTYISGAYNPYMDSVREKIIYSVSLAVVMIIIGAFFYNLQEGWNWVDSVYFAVSTLTTVGFGDLHPTHPISRLFMIFYMLIGIPIMFYTITMLGIYSIEKRAYTKPLKLFGKHHINQVKGSKAKQLAEEIETLSDKMNEKIKALEQEQKQEAK